jgi:RHS repeat-associated protein
MEYRWDIRDRLTGISVKNALGGIIRTAEYTYDVYNQRIAKTVDSDGDGSLAAVTERFVYGPDQNIALVFDENGNVNHRYLFGNGVDQIEADESNGNVLWALSDHLGSVRDVVDDSGTVLNHVVYDAFGGVTSQTDESVVFRYGYTASELDAESGLQYNRARYLDSFTGKFISEDPISFQAGDSNLYRYVFNSPIRYSDPSGLQTASDEIPGIPGIPFPDLGSIFQGVGNGILEIGKAVERTLVPPAEAPTFPSNPQASKKRNPAPTPSPSPNPTTIPFCRPTNDKKKDHRGRIQAQGGNTEKSERWAQLYPLTRVQGLNLLVSLESQLTNRERKDREIPLQKAKEWVNSAASKGGVSAYVQKNFLKQGSKDIRIDIEVNKGEAFVP